MRDLADVSMNLQPNDRASASPSVHNINIRIHSNEIWWIEENHTLLRYLSLAFQITFVAYNDNWEVILILDPQNLLLEGHDLLEALSARNAVHQQESLPGSHVLLSHCRVFFLTRRIEHI